MEVFISGEYGDNTASIAVTSSNSLKAFGSIVLVRSCHGDHVESWTHEDGCFLAWGAASVANRHVC